MPLGLIGAGVNLAADLGTKHFYVFITDQRIIFERIKHGVATPRRTDEVYVWRLADVSNLRMESSDWKSPGALWTKWLRFESRSGPAAITNLGVRTESSPVLR
jgi:hypothetical protein